MDNTPLMHILSSLFPVLISVHLLSQYCRAHFLIFQRSVYTLVTVLSCALPDLPTHSRWLKLCLKMCTPSVVAHAIRSQHFYLRMYKDAKTGLMLINVADFDLLNDQALTPQLLRAKPMYALAATIPPPTCLTGGTTASGEQVDILRSLTPLPGNHTLRFAHVAIGLDVMDEYPDTDGHFRCYISERHCGRIRDSLLEIEKIAKCRSKLCVDDSQRRYTKRTSFSLIAVLSEILPAVLCETIGEFIRPRSPRL